MTMTMTKMRDFLFISAFVCIVGWGPFTLFSQSRSQVEAHPAASSSTTIGTIGTSAWLIKETKLITSQASNLSSGAVKAGLTAYQKAREKGLDSKEMLTIIDFTKPSKDRRLLVFDMKNQKVLFNTWVAHGKNSGEANATSFSNQASSLKSSLGVFMTSDVFDGKHGEALRVQGLEKGVNDNAYRRDIEFHSAEYVSEDVAKSRGMVGRSWGCMAVNPNTIKPLINSIKGNTIVVAYYPDKSWLDNSSFLT